MIEKVMCRVDGAAFKGEIVKLKGKRGLLVTVEVKREDWPWKLFPKFREGQNVIQLASKYVTALARECSREGKVGA